MTFRYGPLKQNQSQSEYEASKHYREGTVAQKVKDGLISILGKFICEPFDEKLKNLIAMETIAFLTSCGADRNKLDLIVKEDYKNLGVVNIQAMNEYTSNCLVGIIL